MRCGARRVSEYQAVGMAGISYALRSPIYEKRTLLAGVRAATATTQLSAKLKGDGDLDAGLGV